MQKLTIISWFICHSKVVFKARNGLTEWDVIYPNKHFLSRVVQNNLMCSNCSIFRRYSKQRPIHYEIKLLILHVCRSPVSTGDRPAANITETRYDNALSSLCNLSTWAPQGRIQGDGTGHPPF